MKTKLLFILCFVVSQFVFSKPEIQYLSPQPNSKYVKLTSSIILRFTSIPVKSSIKTSTIKIIGSKSGLHEADTKLSSDGVTLIITPKTKFYHDEIIQVKIKSIKTDSYNTDEISYSFETEKESIPIASTNVLKNEFANEVDSKTNNYSQLVNRGSTLPVDFPRVTVSNSSNPSPGYTFLSNFGLGPNNLGYYLMILDNAGTPVYYKKLDTVAYDFKKQPNCNLTYFSARTQKFYEMNSNYQIIDSFVCGNGYSTDSHELLLYENGHSYLMSYDPQKVNMANLVSHGDSNAIVIGLIIQELDADKNVIFQWRSWDHFNILDAKHTNFTLPEIDYAHGNAIELCSDGNIMISSRHMDEITKINRSTGNIIWRLGGKRNQFNFENETHYFSHQHAIRELANGNITIFDNGNYFEPIKPIHGRMPAPYSRVIEYHLDETRLVATKVWEYVNNPPIYGFAMGYAERLNNGNTIIGWGMGRPSFTEVNPAGQVVFELSLPPGQVSYRAFKNTWNPLPNNGIPQTFNLFQNYPNPFNPSTTIRYDLPEQSDVKINIFNILGQTLQEEVKLNQAPGIYNYVFNGSNLTSGVYFYRIKTNSFADTKRMVLVK